MCKSCVQKLAPAKMELDKSVKRLLARNSHDKNPQDLDKWIENQSLTEKNEKRVTNVKVRRVDKLAPRDYTWGGSAGGRKVDNNLQRVVRSLAGRRENGQNAEQVRTLNGMLTRPSEKSRTKQHRLVEPSSTG